LNFRDKLKEKEYKTLAILYTYSLVFFQAVKKEAGAGLKKRSFLPAKRRKNIKKAGFYG